MVRIYKVGEIGMYANSFFQEYNQFLPPLSFMRFGDDFLANNVGTAATLNGSEPPWINQFYATTGPELFPAAAAQSTIDDILTPATGGPLVAPDVAAKTVENTVGTNNRITEFLKMGGALWFAVALVAAGIIYMGLTAYKSTAGGLVKTAIKGATA